MSNLITMEDVRANVNSGNSLDSFIIVEEYLPFVVKSTIVEAIIDSCLKEKDGMWVIDYTLKKMITDFVLCNNYSNIQLTEDDEIATIYDELYCLGVINYILKRIPKDESNFIINAVTNELSQAVSVRNSIENILSKTLNALVNRIPDKEEIKQILKETKVDFSNFSPEKLKILNNLLDFAGTSQVSTDTNQLNMVSELVEK